MEDKKITIESLAIMINSGFEEARKDRGLIKADVSTLKTDVSELKKRISNIEETMVTKDFFTDKILELKKEIIVKLKKQDAKFDLLVEILIERNVIKKGDVKKISEISISTAF